MSGGLIVTMTAVAGAAPNGPAPGPVHIIGGPNTGGCIAGAVRLPPEGPGFQTIHLNRSAFWGAPQTIANLELLGREATAMGLPTVLMEDISRARGGPMPGGHVSHQIGLDADVGLDMQPRPPLSGAERDTVELRSMVRPDRRDIDPAAWSPRVTALLHMAAGLPEVDRILVNPAIKQQLCREVSGDRSWLHLIRPWYGHAAHMHIRFRCPQGQSDCVQAAPPPPGDGCDATLQWWFDQLNAPPKPAAPYQPPPLPAACRAILAGK
ncbi:MAG TPA: penicillin-insensitive murein endopeptidase [Rhodopila sp.]